MDNIRISGIEVKAHQYAEDVLIYARVLNFLLITEAIETAVNKFITNT